MMKRNGEGCLKRWIIKECVTTKQINGLEKNE